MEYLFMTTMVISLCFALSILQTHCDSLQLIDEAKSTTSRRLAVDDDEQHQLTDLPALPRKLKLSEDSSSVYVFGRYDAQDLVSTSSYKTKEDHFSGDKAKKKHRPRRGTWREWVEEGTDGDDTSQYFSMDYSHVRRRRPIHNKSLPVAP